MSVTNSAERRSGSDNPTALFIHDAMTDSLEANSLQQLFPLMVVFAIIFAALIFWCFMSSCLGVPLRRSLANLWEYTLLGAMSQASGPGGRGRSTYGEAEIWELHERHRRT